MSTLAVWFLQFILPRRYWYREFYLRSNHWKSKRKEKLKRVGYRCAKCPKHGFHSRHKILDVHHLTYARLFRERMSDLEVLCRLHHRMEHKK